MNDLKPISLAAYVLPEFNLFATLGIVDPFRIANLCLGDRRYEWTYLSEKGGMVATNGDTFLPTDPIADFHNRPDILIISASPIPGRQDADPIGSKLRRWLREGTTIISLSAGPFILARLGLLDGVSVTVHNEYIDTFKEQFPKAITTSNRYEIDGQIITCCGGAATVDLGIELVRRTSGSHIAQMVARTIFRASQKPGNTPQDILVTEEWERKLPSAIKASIDVMKSNIETPLPISDISNAAHVSQRRLEMLFGQYVGATPKAYYLALRLKRARNLVTGTRLSMAEIAMACGYSSPSRFSAAYRRHFQLSPSEDRDLRNENMPPIRP